MSVRWSGKSLPWKRFCVNAPFCETVINWHLVSLGSPFTLRTGSLGKSVQPDSEQTGRWLKALRVLSGKLRLSYPFKLPAGFTSSTPHACPPTQLWFIFSEFCGVTLTWDEFMASPKFPSNFGREKHGNSCCHYPAVTCAAQERIKPPIDTGFMVKNLTEFKERTECSKIWEPGILRSKYLQTWPGHPVLSVQGPMVFIWFTIKVEGEAS